MYGGRWVRSRTPEGTPSPIPTWARPLKHAETVALEKRTHPVLCSGDTIEPILYSDSELEQQIRDGQRPAFKDIRGGFWAEGPDFTWVRESRTWDLPSMLHVYGARYTLKWIYAAWSALPIIIATHRRGKDSKDSKTANRHKDGLQIIEEAKSFLEVTGLPMPQDKEEWRLMFKEMGSFLATKSFLTNTPPPVMQLPVADIHDSKEAMRYRAICDERVTLPMEALRSVPSVYQALMRDLHASSMVEVKVNWRCNTKHHWHARVDDPVLAGQLYAKLGYSVEQIAAFGCVSPPAGTAGAQGPGTDPKEGSHHMLPRHIADALIEADYSPRQTSGELLCLQALKVYEPPDEPPPHGEDYHEDAAHYLRFLDYDTSQDVPKWVTHTDDFLSLVADAASKLPQPVSEEEMDVIWTTFWRLLRKVPNGKATIEYTPLEWENALYDMKVWAERDCEPPQVLKWRHWRPGRLKELEPTTQRAYEVHLRQRWADRLLAHFTPYAGDIPNMAGLLGNRFHQEALDLLGDARFRTIRQHCLMYESLKKKDFTAIPRRESDVRQLLNRLRDEEVTPYKIQQVWDTIRWFSKKFGILDPQECIRLKNKKASLEEELVFPRKKFSGLWRKERPSRGVQAPKALVHPTVAPPTDMLGGMPSSWRSLDFKWGAVLDSMTSNMYTHTSCLKRAKPWSSRHGRPRRSQQPRSGDSRCR